MRRVAGEMRTGTSTRVFARLRVHNLPVVVHLLLLGVENTKKKFLEVAKKITKLEGKKF